MRSKTDNFYKLILNDKSGLFQGKNRTYREILIQLLSWLFASFPLPYLHLDNNILFSEIIFLTLKAQSNLRSGAL